MWIDLKRMHEIKVYEIVVIGEEPEVIRDRGIGYEYESILRLHPDELIEPSISTIFTIGVLSESGTTLDLMTSSCYSMFPRLTRMLRPESIVRSRSPIGYDGVVSSGLADAYRESLGPHSAPGNISDIVCIGIRTQM